MTGLEKILMAIESTAKANADETINEAKKEAERIMEEAKAEAKSKCDEITRKSEEDRKPILQQYESEARLQERRLILEAKQKIIQDVIAKAKNSLTTMPEKEYFDFILRMVKKLALNKPGSIVFSAEDVKRMPEDFEDRLKKAFDAKEGASLTISDRTEKIDGGFILVYGDVEENCSFEALFRAALENLQDKVNALLFS
ncbi:MAG: hypothetical protein E7255_06535 [Lachnospiraceae bacterium]|jgi:V/A-type H+-transporting ATPase subunit E|nr:hypothetical protein [Lachnospiraceae bacterium]